MDAAPESESKSKTTALLWPLPVSFELFSDLSLEPTQVAREIPIRVATTRHASRRFARPRGSTTEEDGLHSVAHGRPGF